MTLPGVAVLACSRLGAAIQIQRPQQWHPPGLAAAQPCLPGLPSWHTLPRPWRCSPAAVVLPPPQGPHSLYERSARAQTRSLTASKQTHRGAECPQASRGVLTEQCPVGFRVIAGSVTRTGLWLCSEDHIQRWNQVSDRQGKRLTHLLLCLPSEKCWKGKKAAAVTQH